MYRQYWKSTYKWIPPALRKRALWKMGETILGL